MPERIGVAMTSKEMRDNPLFMRSGFETFGRYEFPIVKKQNIPLNDVKLIGFSDTRTNYNLINVACGVHFFLDDYRFEGIYKNPERSLDKLSQYAFLLTPDYSTYADMDIWRQMESIAHNRWVGAYWQSKGLIVIPTVSWSTPISYDFCFDGIEKGSIVAIGMIGCKKNKVGFMRGYNAMLKAIEPSAIICFGVPFPEMSENIISVDYNLSRKVVR